MVHSDINLIKVNPEAAELVRLVQLYIAVPKLKQVGLSHTKTGVEIAAKLLIPFTEQHSYQWLRSSIDHDIEAGRRFQATPHSIRARAFRQSGGMVKNFARALLIAVPTLWSLRHPCNLCHFCSQNIKWLMLLLKRVVDNQLRKSRRRILTRKAFKNCKFELVKPTLTGHGLGV